MIVSTLAEWSPDLLAQHAHRLRWDDILEVRAQQAHLADKPNVRHFSSLLRMLPRFHSQAVEISGSCVKVGESDELNFGDQLALEKAVKAFVPWKKGPFKLFSHAIDSEWRSDWKWERILPHISSLRGRTVADVGCHNGYFLFRMAALNPALVIGFDPYAKNLFNFELIQRFAQIPSLQYEILGIEHMHLFPEFFDTVFCLGVLYHCEDPVQALRRLHCSLRPGGELILECQGVSGDDALALVPQQRYANMRGIWFLPTAACLENWLRRTGFSDIQCFFSHALTGEEQRSTPWAPIESFVDFLDPANPAKTREGYPAPWRHYIRATRS